MACLFKKVVLWNWLLWFSCDHEDRTKCGILFKDTRLNVTKNIIYLFLNIVIVNNLYPCHEFTGRLHVGLNVLCLLWDIQIFKCLKFCLIAWINFQDCWSESIPYVEDMGRGFLFADLQMTMYLKLVSPSPIGHRSLNNFFVNYE